ncbi:MAG: hypothetical protein HYX96_06395 [Chloroflexi bacterium]|nr:hypothetical protein [Chloroflexota bacterium]
MQEQKEKTKRRGILAFALWGAIGFSLGGAIGGAIWPSIGQPYFGFIVMGAVGGASLGLALKDWRRAVISGMGGAIGFGIGSYSPNLMFSLLAGIIGVSLGLALKDWKRVGPLVLTGIIGFVFAIFNTWNLSSGEVLWSALMMAIWGIMGGGGIGTTLGYLEKRKTDKRKLARLI